MSRRFRAHRAEPGNSVLRNTGGIPPLLGDTQARIEYQSYPPDEIAVRFHHRLVAIHPFPDGNGRHARLMADLLVVDLGGTRFSWGRANLRGVGAVRPVHRSAEGRGP